MEKIATKKMSQTVNIVTKDGKQIKNRVIVELTDKVKIERYNRKMKRYTANLGKKPTPKGEKMVMIFKEVLNKALSAITGKPMLSTKKFSWNIDNKHNCIPAFKEHKTDDTVITYKPVKNLTKKELISISEKNPVYTGMTSDVMKHAIVNHKMERWDARRKKRINNAPVEQQAFLRSITPEERASVYKVFSKDLKKPELHVKTNKKKLKYGVVITCDYENSKGQRKNYTAYSNYNISTKEQAEKILQEQISYYKDCKNPGYPEKISNKHYFTNGKLLYGGETLMWNIMSEKEKRYLNSNAIVANDLKIAA